jgi:hypothetical protein
LAFVSIAGLCVSAARFLETEFSGHLQDTRIVCARYLTKRAGIDASAWIFKLRMIEGIEGFEAQLQLLRFRKTDVLQQRHVPVVQPRAVEEAPG